MIPYNSEYLAIIYEKNSRQIRSIVNPDYDEQLEDKSWVTSDVEELAMLKIHKSKLNLNNNKAFSFADCAVIEEKVELYLKEMV